VDLAGLRAEQIAALGLPERLEEAIAEARRLTSFGARRRQAQFIGKLMRQLDEESLAAIRKALQRP
jgi:ribosome-associated protein